MINMANTTENIIEQLKKLGNNEQLKKLQNDEQLIKLRNNEQFESRDDSDLDYETEQNQTMCRLLRIQLKEFFGDIHIPYDYFRKDNWNISKVLYDNEDILFYNKKYITGTDEPRFFEVFDKYISMLEEIFTPNNKLFIFLKRWTNMNDKRWKNTGVKSYLKTLLTHNVYQIISPSYISNLFCEICNNCKNNEKYKNSESFNDVIKKKTEKKLDGLISQVRTETKIFRREYNNIVSSYVFEFPYVTDDKEFYTIAFINCIIMLIVDFAEKLINLNVYAIHPLVQEIIGNYVPLDDINLYDPADYNYRSLYIV